MKQSPALEDCLKLLKGERDEQRLAGLLLVTKFCKGDDLDLLRRVYDAVGNRFLDRLLVTGMGKGVISGGGSDNRDAYLQLSVTILAAFGCVPEIASSEYMILKIPLVLEIMSKESRSHVLEECYEFLYLVSSSSEDGAATLYESDGMKVLASQMPTFPDGSRIMEFAMRLVQLIVNKLSLATISNGYLSELTMMVATIVRQFAVLHNALKFEALHLLSMIFSQCPVPLTDALHATAGNNWPNYMRVGVVAILQNRVAPAERLHALILAESTISILGEGWLVDAVNPPDIQDPISAERCLLLVLELSRVEVSVLLNELAYLKYEASKNSSSTEETILLKQRNLAVVYSLVERIIKLISNMSGDEGQVLDESTLLMVIKALNETVDVVIDYLQDAKEHGHAKGNDLLASVRVIGSYLAETPIACKEKVMELLVYMLFIEGEDEPSPFYSVCFLLPMLCQITMEIEGCKALASSGGYKAVVECLIKLIGPTQIMVADNSCIFMACDTMMNLLLKKEQVRLSMDESTSADLLKALGYWAGNTDDLSIIMMASSLCALILDFTSEAALLNQSSFGHTSLRILSQLFVRSLAHGQVNLVKFSWMIICTTEDAHCRRALMMLKQKWTFWRLWHQAILGGLIDTHP
ncbi:neurochondrin isoform X2 [Tripterygium wilfordii]|uniref:neurochondrin isoform X2 n=1 Tax=Tripterygium wilfordii TaxID=458696 RepID=UPI0018F8345C|nr:neurochondrin isoform X2 [Tripterygium wilfordii]